jgi:hypothetical protein
MASPNDYQWADGQSFNRFLGYYDEEFHPRDGGHGLNCISVSINSAGDGATWQDELCEDTRGFFCAKCGGTVCNQVVHIFLLMRVCIYALS